MAVYLGISRTLSLLDALPGHKAFWCVHPKSQPAHPGDLILMYFPVTASASKSGKSGIKQLFRITSEPTTGRYSDCSTRMMLSVEIELLINLTIGVTIREMKRHPEIRKWGAIGRNMQGVTFKVGEPVWTALKDLIIKSNPSAQTVLTKH